MKIGDLFDKFLILLLIITLPLSIYFASKYSKKINTTSQTKTTTTSPVQQEVQPNAQIKISQVFHDQEKNQLIINGKAPVANLNIMALSIITPKKETIKESTKSGKTKESTIAALKTNENVLGQNVEVKAIKANNEGTFIYIYDTRKLNLEQVEIRFEQLDATATIQYDFEAEQRTL